MHHAPRGMTLVDVLVGTSIVVVMFAGIFGLLRASVALSGAAAMKAAALSIANARMEDLRSLPYASLGTVGGIPPGPVAQEEVVTRDAMSFSVRTFISYYDDPKDGAGSADHNGITTDYKRAKVTVGYRISSGDRSVELVSTFAPPGIETSVGGGTLRVAVVDALGAPVPGASVSIENPNTNPAVDVTTFTDYAGYALFPGAATSTGYRITAAKPGWSVAKTYAQTAENQNPTPGHLTVAGGQTTTGTFAIDRLADLAVRTFSPVMPAAWSDTFADAAQLASMSGAAVADGSLTLATGAQGYALTAEAASVPASPTFLAAWHEAAFTLATPPGTSARVRLVDGSGTLVPDGALPGNGAGFVSSPIDLSGVAAAAYPSLALYAELSTNATTTAPSIEEWGIAYSRGPVPLPSVSFTLRGAKTIGSTALGAPVYKTQVASETDASGVRDLSLEWDSYALSLPGNAVIDACPAVPLELPPGASMSTDVVAGAVAGNALRIYVKDAQGEGQSGFRMTLSRPGFARTLPGNACGFAFFGGLSAGSDYALTVARATTTKSFAGIGVSGLSSFDAILD